ncbi:phage baseplate assembly protein V [Sphingobium wenxiniae]|uniref:Phage baseplate assembly protein V n=1 Tax=Sphingobium wenxiniae (strain DSM 21828 / CGMCC 1.7748 / JZ-1) TaxID=595605 RepID=A0A562KCS5_SPHWJ|nr:phage baseplate assembly protein V [Sphingobium wenxiniae]MBB6191504.1 phage baseplate assembly protein V [Sphingobium wenxiniae]TWH93206.1 phage baseplate assembly protein V [Sphingobium wenxiniae]
MSDIEQQLGDIARIGTVASVDHAARTCTVETGDIVTGPLPWMAMRAGRMSIWSPPSVGEQVLLICPEGDTEAGIILPGLYSDDNPPPSSSPDEVRIAFDDDAFLAYDMAAHALTAKLPSGGTIDVEADGGVSIKGDVTVDGTIRATGLIKSDDDVWAENISLKHHGHGAPISWPE